MMRNVILINATVVILHMTIVITHAAAHGILDVNMSLADYGFITLVILIAPVTAGILLGTRHRRLGAIMLGLSMFGSCIYGVYNHIAAQGIDNIAQISTDGWGTVFRVTAILLAAIEGLGSVTAIWAFNILKDENVSPPV